ncbi:MAG: nthB [Chloroflexi bacterium]|nr:nthB [Chloroflexota bacterium]
MNGVHDMGGMHGFGPVQLEEDEPVFHEAWEGRLAGMRAVVGQAPGMRPGGFRFVTESLDPAYYLTATYAERQLHNFTSGLIKRGLITPEELADRIQHFTAEPDAALPRDDDPEKAERAVGRLVRREPCVRVRNVHPKGHTRVPRYVRGKSGVIRWYYGAQNFLDHENANDPIPPKQPVYSVQFDMRELWGESAEPGEHLYIDLWESHIEHA